MGKADQSRNLWTRRRFISRSIMGLGVAGGIVPDLSFSSEATSISRVVLIRDKKVIDESGAVQQDLLQNMLDMAITRFTGQSTLHDAWRGIVNPEEIIGLKINTLGLMSLAGTPLVSHYSAVTGAIAMSLKKAGVPEKNLIIWDRSDNELTNAGLTIQKDPNAMRVMGTIIRRGVTGIGYTKESFSVGEKTSHISRILTDHCTALINVPVLKVLRSTGVSCSLKNHYGTIDNPRMMHGNNCTGPGIPEVNAIPVIRRKQRLIICDALLGLFDGGPWWQRANIWPYGGIIVGTDPVAVDTIVLGLLNEKRQVSGLGPITTQAKHVKLSEGLGIGTGEAGNIEFIKKELG